MTIDLQVLHGANTGLPSGVYYALPNSGGLEGTLKLGQKFADLFLRQYDALRNRGTNFVTIMGNGRMQTDAAVITNFTAAVNMIMAQLGDQSALPTSEQIGTVTLLAHTLFSDTLTLTVQITTPDGSTNFVIPLTQV
jgi:hypothetical protein